MPTNNFSNILWRTADAYSLDSAPHHCPDRGKTAYSATFSMALILLVSVGQVNAQSQFVPFNQFMKSTAMAKQADFSARSDAAVKSAQSFEEMRQHVLTLYKGVNVTHSFMLDKNQFDCVPIGQQPSLRAIGLQGAAPAPPETALPSKLAPADNASGQLAAAASQISGDRQFDEFSNSTTCEDQTIPMRRITLEEVTRFGTLNEFFQKGPGEAGQVRLASQDAPPASSGHS
jgi:hypothetical protein